MQSQIFGTNPRFPTWSELEIFRRSALPAMIGVMLALNACATLTGDSSNERKVKAVEERASARWKAIIDKNFEAAYGYLSPASRATVTQLGFKAAASRLQYRNAKVKEVACAESLCSAKIELTYDTKMMKGVHTPIEESWIIDRGQAWYVWPMT